MPAVALELFSTPEQRREQAGVARVPRAYQTTALESWEANRKRGIKRQIGVMFTGAGKTPFASWAIDAVGGRTLFLVHRTSLKEQSLGKLTNGYWQVEQADQYANPVGDCHVMALVQSLSKPERYKRFKPDAFKFVVVDEVHKQMGPEYRAPVEYFASGGAEVLALTATPADISYKPLYEEVAFNLPLSWAQRHAWSTPFHIRRFKSSVVLSKSDWSSLDALDEKMATAAAEICKAGLDLCGDLRTIVFCPRVKTVQAACDALNKAKPGCARMIYGDQDKKFGKGYNAGVIRDHKAGKFQFLVSCDMVREGYDDEFVGALLIAKPMDQVHDYEQVMGRGSRLYPGLGGIEDEALRRQAIADSPKPYCLVIDLACVSEEHDIVDPVDVLGGDYTKEEKERARKQLEREGKRGGIGDPIAALEAAREHFKRREAIAKAAADAKVKLQELTDPPRRGPNGERLVSDKQERCLNNDLNCHRYDRDTLTYEDAQALIRKEKVAQKHGFLRYDQRQWLDKMVCPGTWWGIYASGFEKIVKAWRSNGNRKLTEDQVFYLIGRRPSGKQNPKRRNVT